METGQQLGDHAVRWGVTVLLGLAICAAPAWFWGRAWSSYFLHLDDFVYLAASRSGQALMANLFRPHNAHVVPFFRVETYLLAASAGKLQGIPAVLGLANDLTLVLAMLATGHLVAHETGQTWLGLSAMAAVGLSTVMGPAVLRYASGQALMSGVLILLMLMALQAWRDRGGWLSLALAGLAGIAAPLCWSAGYAAGPTALAYLWPGGKRSSRVAGTILLGVSVLVGLAAWSLLGPVGRTEAGAGDGPGRLVRNIPAGLSHTARAIPEILILNNLGLDARTEEVQGWALCLLPVLAWYASTVRSRESSSARTESLTSRISPLQAAGVMLILVDFGMVYTARGSYTFENVRALGWYHAIPQLGAVLFAAGSWPRKQASPVPRRLAPPSLRELARVLGLVTVLFLLQWPRANRVLFEYDGAAAPVGGETAGAGRRTGPSSPADLTARARAQRQVLGRLDRLEEIARARGIGRSSLRRVLGRVIVPGMPESIPGLDAASLLRIPERGTLDNDETIRAAVAGILDEARP
jgi:hypothetical protein